MFIQSETTPDPATLKFLPGRPVLPDGTLHVRDRSEAQKSPLTERLFEIPEVAGVVCGADFVAITKSTGEWQLLKPAILRAIMEHFLSGAPLLRQPARAAAGVDTPDSELAGIVREALRDVIDPELGYNIVDLGLIYGVAAEADGVIRVTMTTTTSGCPATGYLRQGVQDRASMVPGVSFVGVNLTYEPHWTPELMSPQAKAHFGARHGNRR